ncbi:hypothetical protein D3C87_1495780 [compost metagenome]
MVIVMHYVRSAPVSFQRDSVPCHRFGTAPPVTDMRLTDVIRHWRTIAINFDTPSDVRHIEILLRVAQTIWVYNLNRSGISPTPRAQPIRAVLKYCQRVAVQKLMAETQPQHLRHSLLTLYIAETPRIVSP